MRRKEIEDTLQPVRVRSALSKNHIHVGIGELQLIPFGIGPEQVKEGLVVHGGDWFTGLTLSKRRWKGGGEPPTDDSCTAEGQDKKEGERNRRGSCYVLRDNPFSWTFHKQLHLVFDVRRHDLRTALTSGSICGVPRW